MKIETLPLDDHQVKLTLEVEPDVVEAAKHKAAKHIAQRAKIPGFRPGKAPYQVVLRQYGEAAIFEDAIDHLVDDLYPRMIEEAGIKPYGPGRLENVVSMDPMVLEFVVPLQAEVTLGDYSGIRAPFNPPEVDQEAVDALLNELRERQAVLELVERPAQAEDVVEVYIRGERMNPEEGKNPEIIEEMPASILVKAEDAPPDENEWPYPGFSITLIGKSAGEEFTIETVLPEDHKFEELRGLAVRFEGRIDAVKSRTLPELNDEFATMISDKDTLEELIEDIRRMLEIQGQQEYFEEYDDQVLDAAVALTAYKYPPQMIENEIDQFVESFKRRLVNEGMDYDVYLKVRGIDERALREEFRPAAEKHARRSLMLFEIATQENFQVNRRELNERSSQMISQLVRNLNKKDAAKFYDSGAFQNVVTNIMADMLTTRAVEYLRQIASEGAYTMPPEEENSGKIALMQDLLVDGPKVEQAPSEAASPEDAPQPAAETPQAELLMEEKPTSAPAEPAESTSASGEEA